MCFTKSAMKIRQWPSKPSQKKLYIQTLHCPSFNALLGILRFRGIMTSISLCPCALDAGTDLPCLPNEVGEEMFFNKKPLKVMGRLQCCTVNTAHTIPSMRGISHDCETGCTKWKRMGSLNSKKMRWIKMESKKKGHFLEIGLCNSILMNVQYLLKVIHW